MSSYILYRQSKVATLKQHDMTAEMISQIFQVQKETLFLSGENTLAIFPHLNGQFNHWGLVDGGCYEVHGISTSVEQPPGVPQTVRFSSHQPCTGANCFCLSARKVPCKTFLRSVLFAELINGRLQVRKIVTVHFTEAEACVATITRMVKVGLGLQGAIVLTDIHGNQIIDSEETRGSAYWIESSSKVFALLEDHRNMLQANKRRRLSQGDETGLRDVAAQIQHVVQAARGLKDVSETIRNLCGFRLGCSTLANARYLSEAEITTLKEGFRCLVCRGPLCKPIFSTCCRSLIGCNACVMEWNKSNNYCPKCRAEDLKDSIHEVAGLCEALVPLHKLLQ